MARVKFSSIVTDVSGSVGQACFQKYSGGTSLRNKPFPRSSYASAQYLTKSYISLVQNTWASLTSEQQSSWDSFISFVPHYQHKNHKVQLTGFTLFLKYNLIRLHTNLDILTSFNFTPFSIDYPLFNVVNVADVFLLLLSQAIDPAVGALNIKMSPVKKNPTPAFKSRLRVINPDSIDVTGYLYTFTDAYSSRFGYIPQIGDKFLMSFTLFSVTNPIILSPAIYVVTVSTV